MNRTKIVATIGPASNTREKIHDLAQAGVRVFRLNFSHGSAQDFVGIIDSIRSVEEELCIPLTIMQDLSGPKIRLGDIREKSIEVTKGMQLLLGPTSSYTTEMPYLPFDHDVILETLVKGDRLVLADGGLQFFVYGRRPDGLVILEAENEGMVTSRKGLALPGKATRVRALTEKDKRDLREARRGRCRYLLRADRGRCPRNQGTHRILRPERAGLCQARTPAGRQQSRRHPGRG